MRAEYDSEANAIAITLVEGARADSADRVHPRAVVALDASAPVTSSCSPRMRGSRSRSSPLPRSTRSTSRR